MMLPMDGWIKLHRSMLSWGWWDDDATAKAFITILLMCSSKNTNWHGEKLRAGEFVTSRRHLAMILHKSEQNVRTLLSRLEKTGEIKVRTNNKRTIISVCNWMIYQGNQQINPKINQLESAENQMDDFDFFEEPTSNQPADNQQITNDQPASNHNQEIRTENKEGIKKESKEKDPHKKNFVRPTLEEIKAYCQENGLCIDAEYFFDYYNSNGWKVGGKSPMKDWRATARNWARRQVSKQSENHGNIIHEYKFRPDESGTEKLDWEQP